MSDENNQVEGNAGEATEIVDPAAEQKPSDQGDGASGEEKSADETQEVTGAEV